MESLIKGLEKAGWKQFPVTLSRCDVSLYKGFTSHEECRCNNGKPKQVGIHIYMFDDFTSCSIQVVGDVGGDNWVKLESYGNENITPKKADQIAQNMLAVWDFAVKNHKS